MVSLNKKIKVGQRAFISWYGLFVVRLGIAVDDTVNHLCLLHYFFHFPFPWQEQQYLKKESTVKINLWHCMYLKLAEECVCVRSNISLKLKIKRIKQHVALDFFLSCNTFIFVSFFCESISKIAH